PCTGITVSGVATAGEVGMAGEIGLTETGALAPAAGAYGGDTGAPGTCGAYGGDTGAPGLCGAYGGAARAPRTCGGGGGETGAPGTCGATPGECGATPGAPGAGCCPPWLYCGETGPRGEVTGALGGAVMGIAVTGAFSGMICRGGRPPGPPCCGPPCQPC